MIFPFGRLRVQVDYARTLRERQETSHVGATLYRVTLKAPGKEPLIRTTWKTVLIYQQEETRIKNVAVDFMYSVVQAWAKPKEFIRSEISTAEKYAESPEDREEIEEKKALAKELVLYAAQLDPYMEGAVDALWAFDRRDDEKRSRGPREWFPQKG